MLKSRVVYEGTTNLDPNEIEFRWDETGAPPLDLSGLVYSVSETMKMVIEELQRYDRGISTRETRKELGQQMFVMSSMLNLIVNGNLDAIEEIVTKREGGKDTVHYLFDDPDEAKT